MSAIETTGPAPTEARATQPDVTGRWLDMTSMPSPHVLIVEDDPAIARLLVEVVKTEQFRVSAVSCAHAALDALKQHPAHILLTDFKLPDMDGLSLLEQVMRQDVRTIGIVMTGFGTVDLAVKAMKLGASDILIKPFEPDQVVILLKRIREIQRLRYENGLLKQAVVRDARVRLEAFHLEDMDVGPPRAVASPSGAGAAHGDSAAYQRGLLDGERRAREEAGIAHERREALLASAIQEFERARAAAVSAVDEQVTNLALAIASKIVRQRVEDTGEVVLTQVREAMMRVRDSRDVLIRVHPEDLPYVEGMRAALQPLFEGPVVIRMEADAAVARGGCLLETPTKIVDATLEAQLAGLGDALRRAR